jgi:hypothetical protein
MRVLIACEFSGIVRDAFKARGYDAWSCNLLPTERLGNHIQRNILEILNDGWNMMIAFPPCTHLAVSGARWFKNKQKEQEEAIKFVESLWAAPINKIAIENPVGVLSTKSCLGKPRQIIQPYWFGHEAQKQTCLWLKNLPRLRATNMVDRGKIYITKSGKKRGGVWTMCLPPSPDRWKIRSRTFYGVADAMAEQWG